MVCNRYDMGPDKPDNEEVLKSIAASGHFWNDIQKVELPALVDKDYASRYMLKINGGWFVYGYLGSLEYFIEFLNHKGELTEGSHVRGNKMVILNIIEKRGFKIPSHLEDSLWMDMPI